MRGWLVGRNGWLAAVVFGLLLSAPGVAAQGIGGNGVEADLGAWAAARLDTLVAEANVPGAVLAVVSGCSTLVLHGVGLADVAGGAAMHPSRTRVRVGSVSKVLTATVAVGLAEAGAVSLHAPVDEALGDVDLAWTYPDPVTLHHLLTHTSGLPDRFARSGVSSPAERLPLDAYFARSLPTQQRRPGEVKIYSSHGIALAGLLVERAAGQPFAEVARARLFMPLGMERTTFDIPVDDPDLAIGYGARGPALSAAYHFHIAPGADAVTTADDMARFLRFQLGCGAERGEAPLDEEGLARLQTTQFRNATGLPGMAYGWEEWLYGGERWLRKPGSAAGFTSVLAIQPERGVGVFLAYNRDMHPLHARFLVDLADRLAGTGDASAPAAKSAEAAPDVDVARLAGWYRHLRYDRDSWEKLIVSPLLGGTVRVEAGPAGTLRVRGHVYEPRGGLVFERRGGGGRIAFRTRAGDPSEGEARGVYLFIDGSDGHERLRGYETPPVQAVLLIGAILVFVLVPPGATIVWRRRRGGPALGAAVAASLLDLVFVAGVAMFLPRVSFWDIHYGTPASLTALSLLPVVATLLLGAAVLKRLVRRAAPGQGSAAETLIVAAAVLAQIAFVLVLGAWNLFGLVR